jgi:hypothetical protein
VDISEGKTDISSEDLNILDHLPAVSSNPTGHSTRGLSHTSIKATKKQKTVNVGRIAPNSVLGSYTLLTESFHEQVKPHKNI